jgi:hypothetical protein
MHRDNYDFVGILRIFFRFFLPYEHDPWLGGYTERYVLGVAGRIDFDSVNF